MLNLKSLMDILWDGREVTRPQVEKKAFEILALAKSEVLAEAKEEFFVSTRRPYAWSSGPQDEIGDPYNSAEWPFTSIESAKAYAEKKHDPSWNESSVECSYGVRYIVSLPRFVPLSMRTTQNQA